MAKIIISKSYQENLVTNKFKTRRFSTELKKEIDDNPETIKEESRKLFKRAVKLTRADMQWLIRKLGLTEDDIVED